MTGDNGGAFAIVEPRWQALLDVQGADEALLALGKVFTQSIGRLGNERRDVIDRRIQIAEKIGDRGGLSDSLTALSVSYSSKGATETARILMSAAADLARSEHVPVALARCLSNLTVEFNLDDLDRALETGREAVDVAARSGVAVWRDYTEANLMLALLLSGGWAELDERLAGSQSTSVVAQVVAAGILGSPARGARRGVRGVLDRGASSPERRPLGRGLDRVRSRARGAVAR